MVEKVDLKDFANFLMRHPYPNKEYKKLKNHNGYRTKDEIERITINIVNWSNKILRGTGGA